MFNDVMIWIGVAVLAIVPIAIPWWISHCDKIGIQRSKDEEEI